MAAGTGGSGKLSVVLGIATLAVSVAALTFGAGIASAGPNDPGMTDVTGDGAVNSRQAASTSGAKPCAVDPGTLGTATSSSSDLGVPMQTAHESGPSWVGSDDWNAIGATGSNPWRGNFNQGTTTGPHCKTGKASSATRF
jgi:hypothetical protein